jgi:enoyl-CoA hydratase
MNVRVTRPEEGIARIQLHRPEVLNALNLQLMEELVSALESMEKDEAIRCIIITGDRRAFAAGADIDEMSDATAVDMLLRDQFATWDRIRHISKPLIAAVSGYALGGGCELAMACDLIIAAETAKFGQPEINIGVMPGAGGTQRLTRAVGKARAMEMVLTGKPISAEEALQAGLINRVVPEELLEDESLKMAREIASKPPVAVRLAKKAVLKAMDTTLETGLAYEQMLFYLLFATEDQREGMQAFLEKRKPQFRGR